MERNYDIKSLLEFAKLHIEYFDEKYEMFLAKPEDLIGKKVISIRTGFSYANGGQIMLVDNIKPFAGSNKLTVRLLPCDESILSDYDRNNHTEWSCDFDKRCESFIFYKLQFMPYKPEEK